MKRIFFLLVAVLLLPLAVRASVVADTIVVGDTVYIYQWVALPPATAVVDSTAAKPRKVKTKSPKVKKPVDKIPLSFAWGAETSGQIDMTASDMSAFGFSVYLGLRYSWMKFLGVGATADVMMTSSSRSFPVFLNLRTNFRPDISRFFLDLRGGAALSYLPDETRQLGYYGSGGLGIRLASSKHFSSHIVVGYTWLQRSDVTVAGADGADPVTTYWPDLHYATIRLGVSF